MTKHNHHDMTWRAVEMGSEGWAVFMGPLMLASNLIEHHARLIAAAPDTLKERDELKANVADLLEALKNLVSFVDGVVPEITYSNAMTTSREAIRKAEESNARGD